MDTVTPPDPQTTSQPVADAGGSAGFIDAAVTGRRFLRGAALAGTGLVAATVAACTPGASQAWEYATSRPLPSGVIVDVDRPGVWAFHCHVLPHVEGTEGMFGMASTLTVTPTMVDLSPLLK